MNTIPFKLEHIQLMRPNAWQLHEFDAARQALCARHEYNGWSVFDGEDLVLIGGVVGPTAAEPYLWSFISANAGPRMLALLRITERFISTCREPVLYATTPSIFSAGCRFLRMLRFVPLLDEGEQLYIENDAGMRDLFWVRHA